MVSCRVFDPLMPQKVSLQKTYEYTAFFDFQPLSEGRILSLNRYFCNFQCLNVLFKLGVYPIVPFFDSVAVSLVR